jgi:3-methyl-2-oxobutanoate hydroxymethyltransferase
MSWNSGWQPMTTLAAVRLEHRAIQDIVALKAHHTPIVMVTAYDYSSARAAEASSVDMVLVGDSAATTMLGLASTREVTLDEMLMITRAVRRGLERPLLIGDMPFGTYEASNALAVGTARRFVQAGCDAVKMEGAGPIADRVEAVVTAGIPVMGHVGLTPQQLRAGDVARVAGRTANAALRVLEDALQLQEAGCFALVFEAMPAVVAARLMELIAVPVIGIGAGGATDGQVLVAYDLFGLTNGRLPRFVKQYADLQQEMVRALTEFADDVRHQRFPAHDHTYGGVANGELAALERGLPSVLAKFGASTRSALPGARTEREGREL